MSDSEPITTYGIIGYPVKHSLSPRMHNAAFEALGLDAVYKLFELKEDELPDFFEKLRSPQSPIFGLNVTVPYKEKVLEHIDSLSPFAEKAHAVNTIVVTDKRHLQGHNTDGPGFLAHLLELGFDTTDKRIAILGAGGTCKAILTALGLLPERPDSIRLYNRTRANAEAMVADLGKRMDVGNIAVVEHPDDLNIELADLLINTTSVGLKKDDVALVNEDELHKGLLVYDVIYRPGGTALLAAAERQGAATANGLGMLYFQGVLALEHWAGITLPEDIKALMRQRLEEQ